MCQFERVIVFIPPNRNDIFEFVIISTNGTEKGYHQKGAFETYRG